MCADLGTLSGSRSALLECGKAGKLAIGDSDVLTTFPQSFQVAFK